MERDFLADFLGVLERDLLDRLGVRGDDGDLNKKMAKINKKWEYPEKQISNLLNIQVQDYICSTLLLLVTTSSTLSMLKC